MSAAATAVLTGSLPEWLSNALPHELARIDSCPANGNRRGWLSERGIEDGDYIFSTKPTLERQMTPGEGRTLRTRVWACGMLATIGYRGELAVKLVGNKLVPLSASDIRKQINKATEDAAVAMGLILTDEQKKRLTVDKAHVRRAIAQLEADGEAIRTLGDGRPIRELPQEERKGLTERDVLLFFFFRPLVPEDPQRVGLQWLPEKVPVSSPLVKATTRHLQLLGLDDWDPDRVAASGHLCEEVRVAAERIEKALGVARKQEQERLKVAAGSLHIRKIEVQKILLKEDTAAAAFSTVAEEAGAPPWNEPPPPPTPLRIPIRKEQLAVPNENLSPIAAAIKSHNFDPAWPDVAQLWRDVQARDPQATAAEVVDLIHRMARTGARSPVLFYSEIPKRFPLPRNVAPPPAEKLAAPPLEYLERAVIWCNRTPPPENRTTFLATFQQALQETPDLPPPLRAELQRLVMELEHEAGRKTRTAIAP